MRDRFLFQSRVAIVRVNDEKSLTDCCIEATVCKWCCFNEDVTSQLFHPSAPIANCNQSGSKRLWFFISLNPFKDFLNEIHSTSHHLSFVVPLIYFFKVIEAVKNRRRILSFRLQRSIYHSKAHGIVVITCAARVCFQ